MKVHCKAQSSLEFLMVLTAFLSVLVLLFPIALNAFNSMLFRLDLKNAEFLASRIELTANELKLLSDGSSREIPFTAIGKWGFSFRDGLLKIALRSASRGKKEIKVILPKNSKAELPKQVTGNSIAIIKKEHSSMLLKVLTENS